LGIEWDWLLAHVVQIQQAAVSQVLCIAKMRGVGDVVTKVEFVPNHRMSPKMSGRKILRFTWPLVYRSMAKLSSGLASDLPLMMRLIHVLLTPKARAISIFAPRGLVLKNSSSVMQSPCGWFKPIIHEKKLGARGLYVQLKLVTLATHQQRRRAK
jgi:hypothetical protein